MMDRHDAHVARTEDHLRSRVVRLIKNVSRYGDMQGQMDLFENPHIVADRRNISTPTASMHEFLDYVCDALPSGELYLFGGILRDVAMSGGKGFASDLDLVVEGDWAHLVEYLEKLGAFRNRFGGLRLQVEGWPVDIWAARETWAIREGLIPYRGIESLTRTTILNWDAILLNWRTRVVICPPNYFSDIRRCLMDVVLPENPNPLGAAMRVFRHLCSKEAELTMGAARYLGNAARRYSPEAITGAEIASYPKRVIDPTVLRFFEQLDTSSDAVMGRQLHDAMPRRFTATSRSLQTLLI